MRTLREGGSTNKQAYLAGILVALLLAGAVAGVLPAFADEDDESAAIGGLSGLILYGVIAAVLGTIGYTAYKVFAGRKKGSVPARP